MSQYLMLRAAKLHLLLLPLAALIAILPLLLHGLSCGQDLSFHLQSWLDAAHQLSHFDYPRWAITPAWNAGEPRFVFYPPLSWLLGAGLTSVLPISAAPIAYIFLSLTAAGLAMYHLVRQYASPNAALLAAAFYLANPYILFCAYERTAFAELLAAAWIPLLFSGVFKPRPTVRAIAIPIALLWLTNAPAAVMACYAFALLATLRIALGGYEEVSSRPKSSRGEHRVERPASSTHLSTLRLALTFLYATAFGLALPAFYLIPAAYERRFVQVAMAIIPNMRVQDNFLFTATTDAAHNAVNHTASLLALTVLTLTVATLTALLFTRLQSSSSRPERTARSGETPASVFRWNPALLPALNLLTVIIALLLLPISLPLWLRLPSLQYLQFPWRLLTLLSAVLAFTLALLLDRTLALGVPFMTRLYRGMSAVTLPIAAIALPLALTFLAWHLYAQACDTPSLPATIATLFNTRHGAPPTDEYTPTEADNDLLRSNNPGYWLAASPNATAPNTTPTAAELNSNIITDDTPIPDTQTLSTPAPHHLTLHAPNSGYLILNLRDYPSWRITAQGYFDPAPIVPKRLQRDDGLLAIPLAAGTSVIDVTWHSTPDQILGLVISAIALLLLLWNPEPSARC